MTRRARTRKNTVLSKDDDFVDVNAGRHEIQALNMQLRKANWNLYLLERGLIPSKY
jgi:hypothetical protein